MKDEDLADEIEEIERRGGSADDTRARMRDVIERAYAI
jgi:hypothetical protein